MNKESKKELISDFLLWFNPWSGGQIIDESEALRVADEFIKSKSQLLFPSTEIDKKKKSIYRNSDLKKEEVFNQVFKNEISAGIDIHYYAIKVERWSNTKEGIKRGFYGWRDTILNFADGDKDKNKLRMVSVKKNHEFEQLFNQ